MTEQSSRRRHNTRRESQRQRHGFRTFIPPSRRNRLELDRDGRWNVRGVWRRYRSALEFISGRDWRKIFAHHSARQAHRTHSPRPWEISRGISRLLWQDKTDWLLKRWHFCQQTVKGGLLRDKPAGDELEMADQILGRFIFHQREPFRVFCVTSGCGLKTCHWLCGPEADLNVLHASSAASSFFSF